MAKLDETAAMRYAIALSALGVGSTSPNPPVGCVILDQHGDFAGAGYHQRKGEPHAEAYGLAEAGDRSRSGTAVVTLEPCNHVGLTPACRQSLVEAGIARVVISVIDPTSRGKGGAAELQAAGVQVEVGLLEQETRLVLGDWLTAQQRNRPVTTWAVQVRDGEIASYPTAAVERLRQAYDLVLLGDGRTEEGRPGAHGRDRFSLPTKRPAHGLGLDELTDMFAQGTRTLLVTSGHIWSPIAASEGLIDRIVVGIADASSAKKAPACDFIAGVMTSCPETQLTFTALDSDEV